jgi:hypothetical protein
MSNVILAPACRPLATAEGISVVLDKYKAMLFLRIVLIHPPNTLSSITHLESITVP